MGKVQFYQEKMGNAPYKKASKWQCACFISHGRNRSVIWFWVNNYSGTTKNVMLVISRWCEERRNMSQRAESTVKRQLEHPCYTHFYVSQKIYDNCLAREECLTGI